MIFVAQISYSGETKTDLKEQLFQNNIKSVVRYLQGNRNFSRRSSTLIKSAIKKYGKSR